MLALGSNLGDRAGALALARRRLAEGGFGWRLASSVIETAAVGGPAGQPPYLNQVLAADAADAPGDPFRLLALCQAIEREAGRRREVRWGPRTLDIDLLLFGPRLVTAPELTVPHPRLARRAFVLEPLVEILPDLPVPPGGRTPAELLARLRGEQGGRLPRPSASP